MVEDARNPFPQQPPTTPLMDDFIFGGIEADDDRLLADLRQHGLGLRHLHTIFPLDPRPHDAVTVTAFAGPDLLIDRLYLYYTVDGSDPAGSRGAAQHGTALAMSRSGVRWQAENWGYVEEWSARLPPQPDATLVQYRIEGWHSGDDAPSRWCCEPNLDLTAQQPARYAYHVDEFEPPPWADEAVIYQIFVDRFSAVSDRWLEASELTEFAGGTIAGVLEHLDYIQELGANLLWLSPIFSACSYHGYDTSDYFAVDARFGTLDDLKRLIDSAHRRGLRILLDFVANHTSTRFAPFVDATQDRDSPYRNWYSFDAAYRHGYRSFFNEASMPQLNTEAPAVRAYLFEAARYWLAEVGVDGFRLDYAAGPSHAFWSEFRAVCRAARPDCLLLGEVTRTGDQLRSYAGRLDGCLDFNFTRSLRKLCLAADPRAELHRFIAELVRSRAYLNAPPRLLLPAFLDNHDMNRFLWMAGGDKQRLRLAAGLLFALGGLPIVYYGSEIGLSQPRSKAPYLEEARHPMRWGQAQDVELLAFFRRWIQARRSHTALQRGSLHTVHLNTHDGTWLVERVAGADRVLVAINVGEHSHRIPLPVGSFALEDDSSVQDAHTLPAGTVTLLTPS